MLPLVLLAVLSQATTDAGVDGETDAQRLTVVTGSRTERRAIDSVVPTEVITRAQIEQLGVRDLPQLLQQHPGVEMVYTNRGVGIRLQGLDPEYVLILVDGQRISGRSGSITDISRFSLRNIDRVEIVKGPAAALYGADAMGGVINLITRHPQKAIEGSVRGMFGSLLEGDIRGNVGSKLGPFELSAGGGYRTRQAYYWIEPHLETSGAAVRRFDGDVEVAYVPDADLRAWVRTAYVFTDFTAVDVNDTGAVFDRFQRTEQFDTWIGLHKKFGQTSATLRGHVGLFRDQFLLDQRGSRALDDYSANLTHLWEAFGQLDHHIGGHTLTAGLEGFSELLSSTRIQPNDVQRGRLGIFVQDEWVLEGSGPRVAISPGFRADVDTQFGWAPSPRLAVKIDPTPQLTFRASWGLGFRPPSFSELYLQFSNPGIGYLVQGNPRLSAERSGSVNVSVDYRPPIEGWVLSASGWHTSLTNLINITANGVPNPDMPVTFGYENVTNAYTQGVELSVRSKLSKGAYLDLSYMGIDARDVTRQRALEGRSPHRLNANLTVKYRPVGLELVVRATWHAERPYYLGSGLGFANVLGLGEERVVMAPSYFDLEAQLTYVFRSWLKVFVNGYNLLNSGDQDFNPRPPRGIIGGIQVEL